ncbi:hypothetical protein QCA50_003749 [Cerrena zonata]|uniref:Uncharacterized protein n=1 Tax=Cerrena zonata TaxID=2478898 RepID=A0AAW0GFJ8_9APHY
MSVRTSEQLLHDRVNLARLVRRLEKSVASEQLASNNNTGNEIAWVKSQGTVQKVKFARKLLKRVELYDDHSSPTVLNYEDIKNSLNRLDVLVNEYNKRVAPKPQRPEPILPTIPTPEEQPASSALPMSHPKELDLSLIPSDTNVSTVISPEDLLLSPLDSTPLSLEDDGLLSSLPSSLPSSRLPLSTGATQGGSTGSAAAPAFLQNSQALQEELSAQLAQMATQLKNNTLHFASSLDKDKSILGEAQEKLERNLDVMTKERTRLRDHSSKSWGTTWITILSLLVVLIGFFLTFSVIRLT